MIKDYKIVEVFKNSPEDKELSERLIWKEDQDFQLLVVSLEDESYKYYAEDFISIMYSSYSEGMTHARLVL